MTVAMQVMSTHHHTESLDQVAVVPRGHQTIKSKQLDFIGFFSLLVVPKWPVCVSLWQCPLLGTVLCPLVTIVLKKTNKIVLQIVSASIHIKFATEIVHTYAGIHKRNYEYNKPGIFWTQQQQKKILMSFKIYMFWF